MSEADAAPQPDLLSGWKEISAYIGKSERSAQRWESEIGLPVRRIQTPTGGQIVYASRREIDDWRTRRAPGAETTATSAPPCGDLDGDTGTLERPAAPIQRPRLAGVVASYCAGVVTGILLCVGVSRAVEHPGCSKPDEVAQASDFSLPGPRVAADTGYDKSRHR